MGGHLDATWYPAAASPRGAVLLCHPGLPVGQAYFHRRGRIEALRAAGYHALAFDLSGYGASSPVDLFWDRDVEAALGVLEARAPDLPRHVWGLSMGGYWAHFLLSRRDGVLGACFEDVTSNMWWYGTRGRPLRRLGIALTAPFIRSAMRWMDVPTVHAPHLSVKAVSYVAGEKDVGVPLDEARRLAAAARGRLHVVPGAIHLESIKRDPGGVIACALATFREAEAKGLGAGAAVAERSGRGGLSIR